MTKTVDRFDLFRSTRNHVVSERLPSVQCQLSFFDLLDAPVARQPVDAVCVPMQEIHGARFHTLLEGFNRTTVVDVRKYPTFRLVASDQDRTLSSIRRTGFSYHRRHVHLAEPEDKTGEWRRMADISDFLVWLEDRFEDSLNAIFLVHRQDDARILERCMTMLGRQTGRDWMFRHVADASGQRAYSD